MISDALSNSFRGFVLQYGAGGESVIADNPAATMNNICLSRYKGWLELPAVGPLAALSDRWFLQRASGFGE